MSALYPLKFKTIYKDKIWGGQKINTYLHKDFGSLPNCGETWEISGVKSDVSVVANGNLATAIFPSRYCKSGSRPRFPINMTLFTPLIIVSKFQIIIILT